MENKKKYIYDKKELEEFVSKNKVLKVVTRYNEEICCRCFPIPCNDTLGPTYEDYDRCCNNKPNGKKCQCEKQTKLDDLLESLSEEVEVINCYNDCCCIIELKEMYVVYFE